MDVTSVWGIGLVLGPIFLLILTGHLLRRRAFPSEGFWPQAERLTYFVLFPCLLVDKLATTRLEGLPVWRSGLAMAAAVLAVGLALRVFKARLRFPGPQYSTLFQASIRTNTYIALSVIWALLGAQGLAFSGVAIMAIIPLVNVLSVVVVTGNGTGQVATVTRVLREILRNPLIWACLVGITINAVDMRPPETLMETLRLMGRAALPLGLLAVGAGLRWGGIVSGRKPIVLSSLLKLLVMPALTGLFCLMLGISGVPAGVAVIFTAVPVSPSSYILARQLGGDHRLMASMLTAQTVLAVCSLTLVITVAGRLF